MIFKDEWSPDCLLGRRVAKKCLEGDRSQPSIQQGILLLITQNVLLGVANICFRQTEQRWYSIRTRSCRINVPKSLADLVSGSPSFRGMQVHVPSQT